MPDFDAVLVPTGGAGLLAGVALAVKSLRPEAAVYGVETRRAASYSAAVAAGAPVAFAIEPTLADGLAVATVGANAFAIAQALNRVLIMPPVLCGLDRAWFPHYGRFPGSRFELPSPIITKGTIC